MTRGVGAGGAAAVAAVLGIALLPPVSGSAGATAGKKRDARCPRQSKEKGRQANRRASCKRPKPASSTAPGTISATARAWLLKEALVGAAEEGDSHPSEIEAVLTTAEKAEAVLVRGSAMKSPTGSPPGSPCATWPVYVIAMRGDFRGSVTAGQRTAGESATVISYEEPAKVAPLVEKEAKCMNGFEQLQRGSVYPNLNEVGASVALGPATATRPAKEALSATLIVHVLTGGGVAVVVPGQEAPKPTPDESAPLRIVKLAPDGDVLSSMITKEHEPRVAPGSYEVGALERAMPAEEAFARREVTIGSGQTLEVTLHGRGDK